MKLNSGKIRKIHKTIKKKIVCTCCQQHAEYIYIRRLAAITPIGRFTDDFFFLSLSR